MIGGLYTLTGKSYMSIERQERTTTRNTAAAAEKTAADDFDTVLNKSKAAVYSTTELDAIFEEAAKKYNLSVELLKAVAKTESNFESDCVSSSGAVGIMQLMPETAESLGVENSYDARENIMGGAKYLAMKLKEYNGDVSLALAAYNAGSGAVNKYGGIPPYTETQNYVKKVLNYLQNGY